MNRSKHPIVSFKSVLALTVASCLLAGGNALATGTRDALPSVTVKYGDLNLSTAEGANTLYSRLRRAARSVCGVDSIQPEEKMWVHWKACYDTAIATAVAKVNSPMLTAVHDSKTGSPTRIASNLSPRSDNN